MIARITPGAPPRVTLIHHHPGRLRLRGDVLARSPSAADRLREAVSRIEGVARVVHNRASGSLLIEYAPEQTDADAILGVVGAAGLCLDERPGRRRDAAREIVGAARDLNGRIGEATRGAADLHGVVSFALGAGAVASFVLGRQARWPRWDSLLYWSYTFFRDVHLRDLDRARAGQRPPR